MTEQTGENGGVIRVLIADDQELVRTGFRVILEAEGDLVVVAEAANGAEAVRLAALEKPDVVLMDIRMPHRNGIEATEAITTALPDVRVLILTTFDLDEYAFGGLRAGASGFLLKDTRPAELIEAIPCGCQRRRRGLATGDTPNAGALWPAPS